MKVIWTLGLTILNPFLLIGSIFTAGGGHGNVSPMRFFYPGIWIFDIEQDSTLMWAFLFLQFTVYGIIIDIARVKSFGKPAVLLILFIHIMLFVMIKE